MTLDLKKPVQTRDGRPARILATDVNAPRSIVVAVENSLDKEEFVYTVYPSGEVDKGTLPFKLDIVNAKRKGWLNLYRDGRCYFHNTKEEADRFRDTYGAPLIACIPIEFEEGEGL